MRELLRNSLGIKKRETVLIVTDDNKLEIAAELEKAARSLSNEVLVMRMRPRSRHAEEPPKAVAEAMKASDVVIMPTTMSLSHTEARKKACKKGARIVSLPGVTLEMFQEGGMTADYNVVKKISQKVAEMLSNSKEIVIKTQSGSSFRASLRGRKGVADTGIYRKKGSFGNLPAGEGFIAPLEGESEGRLVFDGSFAGLGVLNKPLEIGVEGGRVVRVSGDKGKLKRLIRKYRNADAIGEIGIGTNPKARIIGNVLEDEKVLGTVHIALGDNHTFGGKIRAEVHLDGIIKNPTVWLDDMLFMDGGKLCFPLS